MSCRIGTPVEILAHGYQESVSSPIYSTAIGLILRGFQEVEAGHVVVEEAKANTEPAPDSNVMDEKNPSWFDNVFRKTKEWFEAEPDVDFKK
jgi:cell division protein FtsA